jgi:internalin A
MTSGSDWVDWLGFTPRALGKLTSTAAIVDTGPGVGEWVIFVREIDDVSLRLIAAHASDDLPVYLYFPPSLRRIGEVVASRLSIIAADPLDVQPLRDLNPAVRQLLLNGTVGAPGSVDAASFKGVEVLSVAWESLDARSGWAPALRELSILDFSSDSVTAIPMASGLTDLELYSASRLAELNGIERFPDLVRLAVNDARRLPSVEPVTALQRLEQLELDGCTGVSDIEFAARLPLLRRLRLADCGDVASMHPLTQHPSLEELWAWGETRFVDGDLTPLFSVHRLKSLAIAGRRHYRPSVRQIKDALGLED